MKLQINLFYSKPNRDGFVYSALKELFQIKNSNEVYLLIHCNEEHVTKITNWVHSLELKIPNVNLMVHKVIDYMNKVNVSLQSDLPYSCKWDDDVYIGSNTWDFIIEHLNELDNNFLISPVLSNGVPSSTMFIDDFVKDEILKNELCNHFINDRIPEGINRWSVNTEEINNLKSQFSIWNEKEYWNMIRPYVRMYGGVHPIRFSYEANIKLARYIIQNFSKIKQANNLYLENNQCLYFCNNIYFIKTGLWRDIILTERSDGYDELPLNLHMIRFNKTPTFIRNGFGIHMAYGCTEKQEEIENFYIRNII